MCIGKNKLGWFIFLHIFMYISSWNFLWAHKGFKNQIHKKLDFMNLGYL